MQNEQLDCIKCGLEIRNKEPEWYYGSFNDYKVVKCPHCGADNIIDVYEDANLDVNNDTRYYE